MLVVADASPLILLGRLALLDLLPKLYERVVAPRAVLQEVLGEEVLLRDERRLGRQ